VHLLLQPLGDPCGHRQDLLERVETARVAGEGHPHHAVTVHRLRMNARIARCRGTDQFVERQAVRLREG
jgi:hypothetical protein